MQTNTLSLSLARLTRALAAISIIPALFLPFYQAFLHGGRRAVDINPRAAAYMAVHVLGAYCLILATCGVIAIYLKYHDRIGKIAPFSLVLSFDVAPLYRGKSAPGDHHPAEALSPLAHRYPVSHRWPDSGPRDYGAAMGRGDRVCGSWAGDCLERFSDLAREQTRCSR